MALVAVAGCSTPAGPSPTRSAGLTKLQVGFLPSASNAPFFIATEKGYFREQGIELEVHTFVSGANMISPLGMGRLDIAGGAPSAGLLNAIALEFPLKIVADKGNLSPGHGYEAMVVRKDQWDRGAFKTPADLKGKTVALSSRNTATEVILATFLRTGGLTIQDVRIVTMPHEVMSNALADGSIDMAVTIEPFVTDVIERGVGVIWKRNDEVTPNHQVAVVLYSPRFLENQPDLARRFMLAYLKAARDYNDAFVKNEPAKKKEVIQILVRNLPIKDPALYDRMVMPGIDPNGRVNVDSLAQDQNWFVRQGAQKALVDFTKAVDRQYVDWALQQLGAYR